MGSMEVRLQLGLTRLFIIHGADGAVGRYSYSGHQWGWIVEVYVATTESGKLDESRTKTFGF